MEKAAEHSRSAAPRRGFKNRFLTNVPRPGLYRLASASRERESKMLFHQRNNSSVATRTQVYARYCYKPEPIMRPRLYNIAHSSRFSQMGHRGEFGRPPIEA